MLTESKLAIVLNNGYLRVYIEHWHGDQTVQSLQGNSINVTTTYGSTTVSQNVDASGAINNTAWNSLPGGTTGVIILQGCPGEANAYNDWGYFDFAPAACNVPVSITINSGTTVVFQEACSQLYPQTINNTFNDNAPPILTCPSDVSVSACAAATATYGSATATDACDPNPVITYSKASGTTFNFGITAVTATATDADNNSSTCTFNVNVNDFTPPALSCPGYTSMNNDPGVCGRIFSYSVSANDNCDGALTPTQTAGLLSGATFPIGSTTVSFSVTDAAGNNSTCSFNVTVNDNEPPQVLADNTYTVYLNSSGTASLSFNNVDNGSTDNCSFTAALSKTSFNPNDLGNSPQNVTVTLTDPAGNQSTHTVSVSIVDNMAPNAQCQNVTIILNANRQAFTTASAVNNGSSDNAGSVSLSLSQTAFDCDDEGPNTVTLTVTDGSGNTSTCTATVNVTNPNNVCNLPPVAACKNITVYTGANCDAAIIPGDVDNGSSDPDGDPLIYTLSNSGPFGVGTYSVTLTVDDTEYTDACTSTVTVQDNTAPQANCKNIVAQLDASGNVSITANDVDNASSDACGIQSLTINSSSFDCSQVGSNTVSLQVTDVNGNFSLCNATVNVVDNTAPQANCKNIAAQLDASGNVSITANDVNNASSDACGIQSLTLSNSSFDCSDYGQQTVTLTVTDNNGNASTCTATVDIQDTVSPIVTCKNYTKTLDASGLGSIVPANVFASATDNCTPVNLVFVTPSSFDCSKVGANTVTLQVIDLHGNTSICNATVTVVDNTAPTVNCKNFSTNLDANGNASINPANVFDSASDACGSVSLMSVAPASFDCTSTGTQSVTLTVADAHGNTATCSASVNIHDVTPPTVTCANASVQLDANGQVSITSATIFAGSSDNCGLIGLQPLAQTLFTCADMGANTVTLQAFDGSGNTASCTATVTVQDNTAPTAVCLSSFTTDLGANGTYTLSPASLDGGSSDNCGSGLTLSVSPSQFDCGDVGTNTVTLTATDASGNTNTCTTSLTINPLVTISGVTITHETCQGYGNGTIVINANTTSNCIIRYSIDGGSTFQFANWFGDLSPNTYNIVVQLDCNAGCETSYQAVVNPGPTSTTWYKDFDGDGYTDGVTEVSCSAPAGYVASALPGDCDYNNPDFHPGQTWYKDSDNDGFSDGTVVVTCVCPSGYKMASQLQSTSGDCSDSNSAICPGAPEICDGLDNDCDGEIDEGAAPTLVYTGNVIMTNQAAVDNFSQCYYKIQGNLTIQGVSITSLANLANLQEITGNVIIKLSSLSDLSGLDNLTTIGGSLTISMNNYGAKLTSLNGLQSLTSIGSNLFIYFNWTLSGCCGIDDLLSNAGVGGTTSIHHNASGCNSVADITNTCGGGSIIIPPSNGFPGIANSQSSEQQRISVHPNPATNVLNVEVEKLFTTGTLRMIDMQGRTVLQQDLEEGMMYLALPVDNLPMGMYQLVTNLDGQLFTEKVLIKK